ncbi:MAG: hypothetical protein M1536_05005 [Firmicutes bacterium]|nr:hypothetical protein [Bacillota bacterium]
MESGITSSVIQFIHPEVEEKILKKYSKKINPERADNLAKKGKSLGKKKESKDAVLKEQHLSEVTKKEEYEEEISKAAKKEMDIWLL